MGELTERLGMTDEQFEKFYDVSVDKANALYRTMETIPGVPRVSIGRFEELRGDEEHFAMVAMGHFCALFRIIHILRSGNEHGAEFLYQKLMEYIDESDPDPKSDCYEC